MSNHWLDPIADMVDQEVANLKGNGYTAGDAGKEVRDDLLGVVRALTDVATANVTNKTLREIHQASNADPSLVDVDWIMCDMVTRFLEIPGIREAVIVAALKHDAEGGYVTVRNGEERIGDIPFQFVWNYLINPEELGGVE